MAIRDDRLISFGVPRWLARFSRMPAFAIALVIGESIVLSPDWVGAATPTADYIVEFDATWSEQTHPGTLPPGPHFSGLIGALHNDHVSFWGVDELASNGIESMAETGSKSTLTSEVNQAIGNATANLLLSGGGINPSPGTVSISFTATEDFSLMTLVSMVAPSPDWFVGVNSLPLLIGNDWRYQIVVPLYVYDAGTDSGAAFTSPDQNTNPADPISVFNSGVFAPPMQFVGTYTITRTDIVPAVPGFDGVVPVITLTFALLATGIVLRRRQGQRRAPPSSPG